MKKFKGVRHGEVALIPVKKVRGTKEKIGGEYLLAHSETGHHHVLEGTKFEVSKDEQNRIFVRIFGDTALVHRKAFDRHRTIVLPPSLLERYEMVEYNPASKATQVVKD